MNQVITGLLTTALLGCTSAAFAASSVDLSVTGSIVPNACNVALSTGNISFGRIASADLNTDTNTVRPGGSRHSTLSVNCDAPATYLLMSIDNRAETLLPGISTNDPMGLGMTMNNEKIGGHYLLVNSNGSSIDGKAAYLTIKVGNQWTPAQASLSPMFRGLYGLGFHDTVGINTGPIAIKDGTYALEHHLIIGATDNLTLTDEETLDGHTTIELHML